MSNSNKLLHLEHIEDRIFDGKEAAKLAVCDLSDVRWSLIYPDSRMRVTTKYDGSPSIVFGWHPEDGRFFVGTKSVFNAEPKICYNAEDVIKHHHQPDLQKKLRSALELLPEVTPKGKVYQGDVMFDADDLRLVAENKAVYFTPNTITYYAYPDSLTYSRILTAELGIAVHTVYDFGEGSSRFLQDMTAYHDVNVDEFKRLSHIFIIDCSIKLPIMESLDGRDNIWLNIKAAFDLAYNKIDFGPIVGAHLLRIYVNCCVRDHTVPDLFGYVRFLIDRGFTEGQKLKTENGRIKSIDRYVKDAQHVLDHRGSYQRLFDLHQYMRLAKDTIIDCLDKSSDFEHFVGSAFTCGEGYVMTHEGRTSKLVNRARFSHQNFLRSKNR